LNYPLKKWLDPRKGKENPARLRRRRVILLINKRRQQLKNNPFHHIATALWHRKAKTVSKKKEYRIQ